MSRLCPDPRIFALCFAPTLLAFSLASPALAEEDAERDQPYPTLGGDIVFRLGFDGDYEADAPRHETNDVFVQMIASPRLDVSDRFSLHSEIRLETITPPAEDRFFEDQGLFVRSLFGTYEVSDRMSVYAGKFTPPFALASLVTPGMYGNSYNKEIELIERIGIGADFTFGDGAFGRHTVSANVFFDDTSFLSESAINNRGRSELSDGGASNTESLESFTLTLQGTDIASMPGLTYQLGLVHQERGQGGSGDEQGFAISAIQSVPLGANRSLTLIGEAAPLWNFDGSDDDVVYTSAGLNYETGPWSFVLSGTHRYRGNALGDDFSDYSIQTSAEYALGSGFSLALAHELFRDENVRGSQLGFRLTRVFDFGP